VIGDVTVHSGVSIWPGVTIRADELSIEIGKNTAILDKAIIDSGRGEPIKIGEGCLISHRALLSGCRIGSGVLIGKNVIILDGSKIGENIEPRSKVSGVPGKVISEVTDEELKEVEQKHKEILDKAREYGGWFVAKQVQFLTTNFKSQKNFASNSSLNKNKIHHELVWRCVR
jgi:carbonic anhydrase/acetyltransferase-like protein (isoleucine patch superfamily)